MRSERFTITVVLSAVLGACGGTATYIAPPAEEYLVPEIAANGTKFFVLQRDYRRPEQNTSAATVSHPGGRSDSDWLMGERNIEQRLTLIMQRTAYCREGFFELYREQTLSGFSVRGECREIATDEDRERFSAGPIPL
ncbi:MAG: hypothetical protein WD071_12985 [Pseudohongiella sp.]|uniref:hypothetical protein n=1 Tax=Pseudohongiella sp. TaxID=1979412 RepID=UPI0034A01C36